MVPVETNMGMFEMEGKRERGVQPCLRRRHGDRASRPWRLHPGLVANTPMVSLGFTDRFGLEIMGFQ
jgi:hypothetical protein